MGSTASTIISDVKINKVEFILSFVAGFLIGFIQNKAIAEKIGFSKKTGDLGGEFMDVVDQIDLLKDMDLSTSDYLDRRVNLETEKDEIKQDYENKRKTTLGLGLMMAYSNVIIHLFSAMIAALIGQN